MTSNINLGTKVTLKTLRMAVSNFLELNTLLLQQNANYHSYHPSRGRGRGSIAMGIHFDPTNPKNAVSQFCSPNLLSLPFYHFKTQSGIAHVGQLRIPLAS